MTTSTYHLALNSALKRHTSPLSASSSSRWAHCCRSVLRTAARCSHGGASGKVQRSAGSCQTICPGRNICFGPRLSANWYVISQIVSGFCTTIQHRPHDHEDKITFAKRALWSILSLVIALIPPSDVAGNIGVLGVQHSGFDPKPVAVGWKANLDDIGFARRIPVIVQRCGRDRQSIRIMDVGRIGGSTGWSISSPHLHLA